jgi:hypothetical protein
MSNRLCHIGRMKIKNPFRLGRAPVETIARFGPARLIRKLDDRHELIGGTANHHAAARKWCSLFAPEVVFSGSARSVSTIAFAA